MEYIYICTIKIYTNPMSLSSGEIIYNEIQKQISEEALEKKRQHKFEEQRQLTTFYRELYLSNEQRKCLEEWEQKQEPDYIMIKPPRNVEETEEITKGNFLTQVIYSIF